jgi:hypothetical protein
MYKSNGSKVCKFTHNTLTFVQFIIYTKTNETAAAEILQITNIEDKIRNEIQVSFHKYITMRWISNIISKFLVLRLVLQIKL